MAENISKTKPIISRAIFKSKRKTSFEETASCSHDATLAGA
jgi:hypothetical protein